MALASLASVGFVMNSTGKVEEDCYSVLNHVLDPYLSFQKEPSFYLKYSNYMIVNGKYNQPLINEFSKKDGKFKFNNQYTTVYEYSGLQVTVLKDRKVILIQNTSKSAPLNMGPTPSMFLVKDSLMKYFSEMNCSKKGQGISAIDFTVKSSLKDKVPYDKLTIEYKEQGYKYLKCIIHLLPIRDNEAKEIIEIQELLSKPKNLNLPENILNNVYSGKQLKAEFAGYTVKDLRTKK